MQKNSKYEGNPVARRAARAILAELEPAVITEIHRELEAQRVQASKLRRKAEREWADLSCVNRGVI